MRRAGWNVLAREINLSNIPTFVETNSYETHSEAIKVALGLCVVSTLVASSWYLISVIKFVATTVHPSSSRLSRDLRAKLWFARCICMRMRIVERKVIRNSTNLQSGIHTYDKRDAHTISVRANISLVGTALVPQLKFSSSCCDSARQCLPQKPPRARCCDLLPTASICPHHNVQARKGFGSLHWRSLLMAT